MAGWVIPVTHTSADGLPLGAEANDKQRKLQLLDTGIFQRILGLHIADIRTGDSKGVILLPAGCIIFLAPGGQKRQRRGGLCSAAGAADHPGGDQIRQTGVDAKSAPVRSRKKPPYGVRFSLENYATYDYIRVYPLYAVSDWVRS